MSRSQRWDSFESGGQIAFFLLQSQRWDSFEFGGQIVWMGESNLTLVYLPTLLSLRSQRWDSFEFGGQIASMG